jgi:hypothetical protein
MTTWPGTSCLHGVDPGILTRGWQGEGGECVCSDSGQLANHANCDGGASHVRNTSRPRRSRPARRPATAPAPVPRWFCPRPGSAVPASASDRFDSPSWNCKDRPPCGFPPERSDAGWLARVLSTDAFADTYLPSIYGGAANARLIPWMPRPPQFFWNSAPMRQEISVPFACHWARECRVREPTAWVPLQEASFNPSRLSCDELARCRAAPRECTELARAAFTASPLSFPGFFFFVPPPEGGTEHDEIADNSWVEVMRVARLDNRIPLRDKGSEGQMWYWLAKGSGIWINVGRPLRSRSAGERSPGCAFALEEGFDSVLLSGSDIQYMGARCETRTSRGSKRLLPSLLPFVAGHRAD